MTNSERAERAEECLMTYADRSQHPPGAEETLTDFLTDALHLFGREAVLNSLRIAEIHHQAELDEEGGEE
jgi:hypothetical protein